ncbi:triose-phosphate isomerase TPI-I [Besnoitia besnoiti]|uniref:Triosephosphate isomerase n=1 Tax=Besnoitia besnoiti TaxID=94643 RepID=A0A2A9MGT8_BESBE|nr:triose-phosphate isomerase TPI-I [Besnoitia besnoiti]PFH35176.1 triose-phosphate isomerase TPI-I [Besnoitia besnoiti]
MVRTPWIGGNWKCNGTTGSITDLCAQFEKAEFDPTQIDVVIFPTALHAALAREKLPEKFHVGLQNCSKTHNGAFTGEISVEMIKDFGLRWVLTGHSERRQYYCETNEVVADKVDIILQDKDLKVVLCVGEHLSDRESGKTNDVVDAQLGACLSKISDWDRVVIAYEPVWAIGTGKVATPAQAQEVHEHIRGYLKSKVNAEVAQKVRIVYGGSVNAANSTELILQPDVDGFLVGGASLKKDFIEVIASGTKKNE